MGCNNKASCIKGNHHFIMGLNIIHPSQQQQAFLHNTKVYNQICKIIYTWKASSENSCKIQKKCNKIKQKSYIAINIKH